MGVGVEREEEMKKLCGERGRPFCALCRFQSISKCSAQVVRLQTPPAQDPRSFQPMETRLSSPLRTSALPIHPCHHFAEEINGLRAAYCESCCFLRSLYYALSEPISMRCFWALCVDRSPFADSDPGEGTLERFSIRHEPEI